MTLTPKIYTALKAKIEKTIAEGQWAVEGIKLKTYWQTGKLIDAHIKSQKGGSGYGHNVIHRLAQDLKTNKTHLYHSLEFYQDYPIFPTSGKLGWSHYKELLGVNDSVKRNQLTEQAETGDLSVRELREEIKNLKGNEAKPVKKLTPRRGKPGVYAVTTYNDKPAYDLGFSNYKILKTAPSQKKVNPNDLYTYKAQVQYVIDGDTLWVWIDLGFGLGTRQKLRLRGIDAPELSTTAGKQAKVFLESVLFGIKEIIVKTSSSDKYDRYLADVFVDDMFVNQLLINEGFAEAV